MIDPTLVISILISLAIIYFVLVRPLFLQKPQPYFSGNHKENQFDESYSLLEVIAELEADYQMGKLSKEDFETISLEYKRDYLTRKKQ